MVGVRHVLLKTLKDRSCISNIEKSMGNRDGLRGPEWVCAAITWICEADQIFIDMMARRMSAGRADACQMIKTGVI